MIGISARRAEGCDKGWNGCRWDTATFNMMRDTYSKENA